MLHQSDAASTQYDYHKESDLLEKQDRLCVALQSLLKEYEVYPNDTTIDSVETDAPAAAPKPTTRAVARSWVRPGFVLLLLNCIALAPPWSAAVLGFALSLGVWVAYERYRCAVARHRAPVRATVTVFFNEMSQLLPRRNTLDDIMRFLDGPGAFEYGFEPIERKSYIRWTPPASDAEWAGFARKEPASRAAAALNRARAAVARATPYTVACLLTMAWAAVFLWRHWHGYSRPMDGVWRVSRHYFEGTPLSFLLFLL